MFVNNWTCFPHQMPAKGRESGDQRPTVGASIINGLASCLDRLPLPNSVQDYGEHA